MIGRARTRTPRQADPDLPAGGTARGTADGGRAP